jgi:hypothetical protein
VVGVVVVSAAVEASVAAAASVSVGDEESLPQAARAAVAERRARRASGLVTAGNDNRLR